MLYNLLSFSDNFAPECGKCEWQGAKLWHIERERHMLRDRVDPVMVPGEYCCRTTVGAVAGLLPVAVDLPSNLAVDGVSRETEGRRKDLGPGRHEASTSC